jgi:phosphoribosylaminoimidazole-succinocarboxamide synthase
MELVYKGKTKDVYDPGNGNYLFKFKDDVTVGEDGKLDPGGNKVGLNIKGIGHNNLRLTDFFFKKIEEAGIFTQYISSNIENNEMTIKPAVFFGEGIEVICRFKAVGGFIRRFGKYAKEGQDLPAFVEITLKDDDRGDPPITKEGLEVLGILASAEYDELVALARKISILIKEELAKKGMELYDIKLEFGKCDGKISLIDEISGGSMRVYKDGKPVDPMDLVQLVLS